MTQEEKQLLFKELCTRLPYGIKVHYQEEICSIDCICSDGRILLIDKYGIQLPNIGDSLFEDIDKIKPYLRPISSMTEEEKKELLRIIVGKKAVKYFQVLSDGSIDNTDSKHQDLHKFSMHYINFSGSTTTSYIDWLNAHHFDYRGLIEKGLAIEATTNMYNN